MFKELLKQECISLKTKSEKLKITPIKDTEQIQLQLQIKQPVQWEQYDVYDIKLTFIITIEPPLVEIRINPIENQLPIKLTENMEKLARIEYDLLSKVNENNFQSWCLNELVDWFILKYGTLVGSIPSLLDMYLGDSYTGETIRRYAILQEIISEPVSEQESSHSLSDEDEDEDEDDAEYWRVQRQMEAMALAKERELEAEERRKDAEEDPTMHMKHAKVSKKELDAQKAAKNKQGVRLRKTGARRTKFDPEAAKAREEARSGKNKT
jgi:hypothetical protein